jgi:very-short-patch-repair endonuclease/uncharacterized membrane protein YphA (DoxX/SURF4 family)
MKKITAFFGQDRRRVALLGRFALLVVCALVLLYLTAAQVSIAERLFSEAVPAFDTVDFLGIPGLRVPFNLIISLAFPGSFVFASLIKSLGILNRGSSSADTSSGIVKSGKLLSNVILVVAGVLEFTLVFGSIFTAFSGISLQEMGNPILVVIGHIGEMTTWLALVLGIAVPFMSYVCTVGCVYAYNKLTQTWNSAANEREHDLQEQLDEARSTHVQQIKRLQSEHRDQLAAVAKRSQELENALAGARKRLKNVEDNHQRIAAVVRQVERVTSVLTPVAAEGEKLHQLVGQLFPPMSESKQTAVHEDDFQAEAAPVEQPQATAVADSPKDLENLLEQTESPIERLLLKAILEAELSVPELQHEIFAKEGYLLTRPDFAYSRLRIAIYCDGETYHNNAERWQRDITQMNRLIAMGWLVLRFTGRQIITNPSDCIESIRAVLNGRTAE